MSESIWDAFGANVDEVPENLFQIQERSKFPVNVEAEVKQWKEGDPWYFVINFVILEGVYKGNGANRMFPLKPLGPNDDKDWKTKNLRTLSNLKSLLIKLGLNADQIRAFRFTPEFAQAISGIKGVADIGPQKGSDQYNYLYDFERNSNAASAPVVEGSYGSVSGSAPVMPNTVPVPSASQVNTSGLDNLANLFNTAK